jgi:uncharacterized protein YjbJ (UPF0337 family)
MAEALLPRVAVCAGRPHADVYEEPDMGINKDQVDGRVKEAAGKIQEVAGKVTGSPVQELKGKVKKAVGSAQAGLGDAKERVKESNREDARQDAK